MTVTPNNRLELPGWLLRRFGYRLELARPVLRPDNLTIHPPFENL
jgi:hypothetical protein